MPSKAKITSALIALFLFSGVIRAEAHAQLVTSNPKVSQVLMKFPSQVSLTFDDPLIPLGNSNQIRVTDTSGKSLSFGPSSLKLATLTVRLNKPTHFGRYKVIYRVVSNDGHPVSGFYYFYYHKMR